MYFLYIIFYLILDFLLVVKKHIEALFKSPPKNWLIGNKGAVIIVQGFGEPWIFFKRIADSLNEQGYKIYLIYELEYNLRTIEESVRTIEKFINTHDIKDAVLLAHSKGGAVVKYFLDQSLKADCVKQYITVATPYHGTILGYLHIRNLNEMRPNSIIANKMRLNVSNNKKILNLYPKIDNYVIPNKNLLLEGAENIQVDVIGHARMMESDETIRLINKYINSY